MTEKKVDDLVRLATASTPAEAHLMEQVLAAEGIRSHAVGDYLDAGIGDIPGFRAEVWVHRDDLAAAESALRAARQRAAEEKQEPEA
jgi:Putative prokaryotic signal transducing protein